MSFAIWFCGLMLCRLCGMMPFFLYLIATALHYTLKVVV